MGLRGIPRSFRGLRPSIRVKAFDNSRWFMAGDYRAIGPLTEGRLRQVSYLLSIFYRESDSSGGGKSQYRHSIAVLSVLCVLSISIRMEFRAEIQDGVKVLGHLGHLGQQGYAAAVDR